MKSAPMIASSILLAALGGCQQGARSVGESTEAATQEAPAVAPDAMASVAPDDTPGDGLADTPDGPKKSIIRADVDAGPVEAPPLKPVQLLVPYPEKGAKPDEAGRALIDGLLSNPTLKAGGAITIWGHSDTHGSDADNLAASRRRAESARDYLVAKGVPAKRITVVAMGEASPLAPNRKLDGSDDPEARAKNRRVEIRIAVPQPAGAVQPPTPAVPPPQP